MELFSQAAWMWGGVSRALGLIWAGVLPNPSNKAEAKGLGKGGKTVTGSVD